MAGKTYDVVGIGNAIVDVIGRCSDAFLAEHGATKGAMRLIDTPTVLQLYKAMGPAVEISGGSAANTMVGIASYGGKAAFIGKVAEDELGRIFAHDIRAAGVTFQTRPAAAGSEPTARSLILVTPDGERTMNTFLGVSPELDHGEVDPKLVGDAKVVYLEGYLFDRPAAKAAFRQAAKIAKESKSKVALTLSDAFCVERHRSEFLDLIKSDVDILFANETEIKALYKAQDFEEAARQAKGHCEIAALTRSGKGSLILADDRAVTIAPEPVNRVVDSTGAGDLYAAGFLFGITSGRTLEVCGQLGSIAAAEVISHVGARPETQLGQLAALKGL
ncbi:MAG: adenosine kinase [Hyphomicrobiaceae bacterium]